jgi:hypothetical protein
MEKKTYGYIIGGVAAGTIIGVVATWLWMTHELSEAGLAMPAFEAYAPTCEIAFSNVPGAYVMRTLSF